MLPSIRVLKRQEILFWLPCCLPLPLLQCASQFCGNVEVPPEVPNPPPPVTEDLALPPQASPYIPPQEELYELGEHFQCLGCGCHIKPSEVVYRPRTVPCLPPAVEHCPVAIEKPGRPPVTVIPSPPKPVMRAPVQPRRPSPVCVCIMSHLEKVEPFLQ